MKEIIPINYENENPTVSGRDLHTFLELDSNYTTWFNRMCEYGFMIAKDFFPILEETQNTGRPSTDHSVSIDMAKEICMIQRNEKGKQARQYFIEIEKKYMAQNAVPALDSKFLYQIAQTLEEKEKKIAELTPKAEFFDAVTNSKTAIDMKQTAKVLDLGIGRTKLFQFLRDNKILQHNNEPYQEYCDRGYFRVIEQKYSKSDGSVHINIKTVVYQKGLDFIRKLYARVAN